MTITVNMENKHVPVILDYMGVLRPYKCIGLQARSSSQTQSLNTWNSYKHLKGAFHGIFFSAVYMSQQSEIYLNRNSRVQNELKLKTAWILYGTTWRVWIIREKNTSYFLEILFKVVIHKGLLTLKGSFVQPYRPFTIQRISAELPLGSKPIHHLLYISVSQLQTSSTIRRLNQEDFLRFEKKWFNLCCWISEYHSHLYCGKSRFPIDYK